MCVRVYLGLHAVILREKGLQGMPGDHNRRLERRAHERVQGFLSEHVETGMCIRHTVNERWMQRPQWPAMRLPRANSGMARVILCRGCVQSDANAKGVYTCLHSTIACAMYNVRAVLSRTVGVL